MKPPVIADADRPVLPVGSSSETSDVSAHLHDPAEEKERDGLLARPGPAGRPRRARPANAQKRRADALTPSGILTVCASESTGERVPVKRCPTCGRHPRRRCATLSRACSRLDLTMNVYSDPSLLDVAGALATLPDLSLQNVAQADAGTGESRARRHPR